MEKLYPHELRHIHKTMLDRYGGLSGEKDPGMIDYVCEKPLYQGSEKRFLLRSYEQSFFLNKQGENDVEPLGI